MREITIMLVQELYKIIGSGAFFGIHNEKVAQSKSREILQSRKVTVNNLLETYALCEVAAETGINLRSIKKVFKISLNSYTHL